MQSKISMESGTAYKMNWISELIRFDDWLETNQLPKGAIALWYALMQVANKTHWQPTFTVAMSVLELKSGFKRSELFEARNILQEKGRITWRQRGGNQCAEYRLIPFCVHNTDASSHAKSDETEAQMGMQKLTINKQDNTKNKTKTKPVASDEAKPREPLFDFFNVTHPKENISRHKKAEIIFPHRDKMFKIWKDFCIAVKVKFEPGLDEESALALQSILESLFLLAENKKGEGVKWSEWYASKLFRQFLSVAYADEWRAANFNLLFLSSNFGSIMDAET